MNLLALLDHLERSPRPAALCTVVGVQGSTPRKAGAKMLVIVGGDPCEEIKGTIGGGAIEHHIRAQAMEAIRCNQPRLVVTSLRNDLAMCCGGEMTVFIEPIRQAPILICFGAGHIAQALCPMAHDVGFKVHVVDARPEFLALAAFQNSVTKSCDISSFDFGALPWGPESFIVVTTHDHQLDQQIIEGVLGREYSYLALVGSERKALMTAKRLRVKGLDVNLHENIHCPAGLAIGAQTPHEIAVSIMAQMIQVKNGQPKNILSHRGRRFKSAHGLS